jgi:hypothetical protein
MYWKQAYDEFCLSPSLRAKYQLRARLRSECAEVDTLAREIDAARDAYIAHAPKIDAALLDAVNACIQFPRDVYIRVRPELLRASAQLYRDYGLLAPRGDENRENRRGGPWAWTLAHVTRCARHVARLDATTGARARFERDAMFMCARYLGDSFTAFAFMVLCLKKTMNIDPVCVDALLETYIAILYSEFGGELPRDFVAVYTYA